MSEISERVPPGQQQENEDEDLIGSPSEEESIITPNDSECSSTTASLRSSSICCNNNSSSSSRSRSQSSSTSSSCNNWNITTKCNPTSATTQIYNITFTNIPHQAASRSWKDFMLVLTTIPGKICDMLRNEHFTSIETEFQTNSMFSMTAITADLFQPFREDESIDENSSERRITQNERNKSEESSLQDKKQLFQKLRSLNSNSTPISPIKQFVNPNSLYTEILPPIYLQETSIREQSSPRYSSPMTSSKSLRRKLGNHLIVFCHGFKGIRYDLRLLRQQIMGRYRDVYCLASRTNENQTEQSLSVLGENLALEIKQYIHVRQITSLTRLSFVTHSMGGLIARSALPHLKMFAESMHAFVSLCTPHTGCAHSSQNALVNVGMWFMQKINASASLLELRMQDTKNPIDSYLYALSKEKGLNWFSHVLLVSSDQDKYVSPPAARLLKSSANNELHNAMIDNISKDFESDTIIRLEVSFELPNSIDSLIGRAPHIHVLESQSFATMLAHSYPQLFA